jgi:hypothetical protein
MAGKRKKVEKREWAVLKPRELPSGKWQVSLGVHRENGKRKNPRRLFSNNADALQFCKDEEARRIAHGQITAGADGVKVAAWLSLDRDLMEAGAGSLKEVGERVLRDTLAVTVVSTAGECLSRYLSHRGKSVYADDSRNRGNHFIRWFGAERQIREATTEVMKAYFSKHTGATLRRTVSAWFGWAVDEGYLPSNPCARKKQRRGTKKKKPPEAVIFSPTDALALLRAAVQAEDWTTLSFIAFGLFAGIRPMEFRKKYKGAPAIYLDWRNVTPDGIEIYPELAKTAARVIPILDPLPLWIEFIRKKRGMLSGPVVATGKRGGGWRKHWEAFLAKHWKHEWHADQLRHSFGSYRMAVVKNAGQVAMEMGNSAQVVLDYYWNWQTKARDAESYWSLTPETVMNTTRKNHSEKDRKKP